MRGKRRVALVVETSSSYGRELLSGIVRYMRMHDEWSVFLEQRDLTKKPPGWLSHWQGDGIMSRATTPELRQAVQATGVPLVELTDRYEQASLPCVRSDDRRIGMLAAEHLLERGYRRFGFCGFTGEAWSQRRQETFVSAVEAAGYDCEQYNSRWHGASSSSWEEQQQRMVKWLQRLRRPFAVMACNDMRGQQVLDACLRLGYAVPEEVAVIGVDNDELLCRVCPTPLSSVMVNAAEVGYRGAEMLDQLMAGQRLGATEQLIAPTGIATRQSTDTVAIDDPLLAEALKFIREHACRGLRVDEISRAVPLSRSTLERQFRKHLGRTPQEAIRDVQVKRVQELLATTDLSAERIAFLCGFEHAEYMFVVFKRLTGTTPGRFRNRHREGGASRPSPSDKIS